MPGVSVVIPVRDGLPYIREALASVFAQSYSDFEVIVVNDGSTDGTAEYLASVDDARLKVIHCDRKGVSAALNAGLAVAAAPLVARMDADDVMLPERLEIQHRYMFEHPEVTVCGSGIEEIDADGNTLRFTRYPVEDAQIRFGLLRGFAFAHPAVMYRRDAVLAVGGYRIEFSAAQDQHLWWSLARFGILANIPDVLLRYRNWNNSISGSRGDEQRQIARDIATSQLVQLEFAPNEDEANACLRCIGSMHEKTYERLSRRDAKYFVKIINNFFNYDRVAVDSGSGWQASLRREFRSAFVYRADRCPRFSIERFRWLFLAGRIDFDVVAELRRCLLTPGRVLRQLLRPAALNCENSRRAGNQ